MTNPEKTVLIVDTNDVDRLTLSSSLEGMGFEVEEAPTLISACSMISTVRPDLVVVKFAMSKTLEIAFTGEEFAWALRRKGSHSYYQGPIIILHGDADGINHQKATELDITCYDRNVLDEASFQTTARKLLGL